MLVGQDAKEGEEVAVRQSHLPLPQEVIKGLGLAHRRQLVEESRVADHGYEFSRVELGWQESKYLVTLLTQS